ncbi:MAG: TlpA disulfide reductase family protein [Bacteroidota bacterium]
MTRKLFYLFLIILASCSAGTKDQSISRKTSESDISKVKLKELNDQEIDLDQFKGKIVFINFWATWCKPCLQEMPSIERTQTQLANENVVFLMASNEEVDQIETFIKKHNYTFHYVHLENMEDLNIQALPTTYIFDAEGKLKFSETGSRKWDDAASLDLITKLMNDHEK